MKKFSKVAVISFVLGLALLFTACANSVVSNNAGVTLSKIDEIKKAGKIVVGTNAYYPPYEFHKEINGKDEIVGFDIDIAREIAKNLGVELEIKDMDFDGLLLALNADKIDFVIAGMTPTSERAKAVDFSQVYYKAVHGVIINVDNKDVFKTVDDLIGKKIGAQKATVQEEVAKAEITDVELKSLSKIPDLILEVKNNKIQGLVIEKPVAKAYTDKNKDLMLMDLTFEDAEGGSAVAIKKGNTDLLDEINKTLDILIKDGSIEKFVTEATKMVDDM